MKYCCSTTQGHPLAKRFPDCVEKIDAISIREETDNHASPFTTEVALNLDKIEIAIATKEIRDRNSTMDMAFGVKENEEKQFILCEYKLNCKKISNGNINRTQIQNKVSYSKRILCNEPKIHRFYLFIFPHNLQQAAYRRLRQIFNNKNCIKIFTIQTFKTTYFEQQ